MIYGLGFFILLLIAAVAIESMRNRQKEETRYHATLSRTMVLTSDAFPEGGHLPDASTWKGEGISPPLAFSNIPHGAKSLALSVTDEELPMPSLPLFNIVHWGMYNIPADIEELKEGVTGAELEAAGIRSIRNWSGENRYYPPRPLYGDHRYAFRIYALDVEKLDPQIRNRNALLAAMKGHVLAYGELNGHCRRQT
jgi:Raf kinase inhibitor-like YbhB/YbcL family protein